MWVVQHCQSILSSGHASHCNIIRSFLLCINVKNRTPHSWVKLCVTRQAVTAGNEICVINTIWTIHKLENIKNKLLLVLIFTALVMWWLTSSSMFKFSLLTSLSMTVTSCELCHCLTAVHPSGATWRQQASKGEGRSLSYRNSFSQVHKSCGFDNFLMRPGISASDPKMCNTSSPPNVGTPAGCRLQMSHRLHCTRLRGVKPTY